MSEVVAVALGGALGSVLRYLLANAVHTLWGRGFPYGTLTVNVLGCLVAGFVWATFIERLPTATLVHAAALTGILGGFTTFSAFSLDTVMLIDAHAYGKAALNVLANLVLCLSATAAGVVVCRQL